MHVGWNWYGQRTLKLKLLVLLSLTTALALIIAFGIFGSDIVKETQPDSQFGWRAELYTPTTIVKIDDKWFIVDCWHNRVLWTRDRSQPIKNWQILSDNLAGPHSIVKFGEYYVVEDTGRNAVKFFTFNGNNFAESYVLQNVGKRPHRLQTTSEDLGLFVLSAASQTVSRIVLDAGKPRLRWTDQPAFMKGVYTRTFMINPDGTMLFGMNENKIAHAKLADDNLSLLTMYKTPKNLNAIDDVFFDGSNYYVTNYDPKTLFIAHGLKGLESMKIIKNESDFKGSPYYISRVGNELLIPEIDDYSRIVAYRMEGDNLQASSVLFDSGKPSKDSLKERRRLPK